MAAFKTHVFQPAEPEPTPWELGLRGNLPVSAPGSTKEKIYTEHFKKDLKHKNLIWWNKHWTNKGFQTVSDEVLENVLAKKVGKKFKYPPWLRTKCTLALLEKKNFFTKARDELESLNQNNAVGKALSQFREFFGDVTQNQEHIVAFIKFYHAAKQTDIKFKMPADKIDMPDIRRMPLGPGKDDDAKQLLIDFKTWMFQSFQSFQSSRDFSQAEGKFLPSEPALGGDYHCDHVYWEGGLGAGILCSILSPIIDFIMSLLWEIIKVYWKPILGFLAGFIALFIAGAWIYDTVQARREAQRQRAEEATQRQREAERFNAQHEAARRQAAREAARRQAARDEFEARAERRNQEAVARAARRREQRAPVEQKRASLPLAKVEPADGSKHLLLAPSMEPSLALRATTHEAAECPVCFEPFSTKLIATFSRFRQRTCWHMVCADCARRLAPKECPICRKSFTTITTYEFGTDDCFQLFDRNADDKLNKEEVIYALDVLLPYKEAAVTDYVEAKWAEWDRDNNETIDQREFYSIAQAMKDEIEAVPAEVPAADAADWFDHWAPSTTAELTLALIHTFHLEGVDNQERRDELIDMVPRVIALGSDKLDAKEWPNFRDNLMFNTNY